MILKKGSKGKEVKELQLLLEISCRWYLWPGNRKISKTISKRK